MTGLIWIDAPFVLALHNKLLSLNGGGTGVRDHGLLASALARPKQHLTYADVVDVVLLAAIYTAGIVQNHPFVDGNKRTGFVVGIVFLELNGHVFTASEEEATQAVLGLASSTIDEIAYASFLRENSRKA